MNHVSNITRADGDPRFIQSGPSSLYPADSLARGLGWFSLGLGLMELLAPRKLADALGMPGKEALIRSHGVREIGAGILSLSIDKQLGLWCRIAGDGLDIATLYSALNARNPQRGNASVALALVLGITALDLVGAKAVTASHSRNRSERHDYRDRSGFPHGVGASRGVARGPKTEAA
jgi:hypothetical protein